MPDQLTFNFGTAPDAMRTPPPPLPAPAPESDPRPDAAPRQFLLQRAVLRWLAAQTPAPTAVALDVPTRTARFKADVAAFWSSLRRNRREEGPSRLLVPTRTLVIECYVEREDCWPDCVRTAEIMPRLQAYKARRAELQAAVRATEPELRDPTTLFEEYAAWHYDRSRNPEYQATVRTIELLERALVEGTRFEQVRSAEVADQLLLAVPAGLMAADEVANGWGLLWVHPDLTVTVEKAADTRDCREPNRVHFVQNIAAAAMRAVLATSGVRREAQSKRVGFVRPPRLRRKPEFPTLPPSPPSAGPVRPA